MKVWGALGGLLILCREDETWLVRRMEVVVTSFRADGWCREQIPISVIIYWATCYVWVLYVLGRS